MKMSLHCLRSIISEAQENQTGIVDDFIVAYKNYTDRRPSNAIKITKQLGPELSRAAFADARTKWKNKRYDYNTSEYLSTIAEIGSDINKMITTKGDAVKKALNDPDLTPEFKQLLQEGHTMLVEGATSLVTAGSYTKLIRVFIDMFGNINNYHSGAEWVLDPKNTMFASLPLDVYQKRVVDGDLIVSRFGLKK